MLREHAPVDRRYFIQHESHFTNYATEVISCLIKKIPIVLIAATPSPWIKPGRGGAPIVAT
jgi:hypothetical protein